MFWLPEYPESSALRDRAAKSLSLPIGLANPLWLAFGAAASAGAAWWLMTSWSRPFNLEAATPAPAPAPEISPVAVEAPAPALALDEAEPVAEAEAAPILDAETVAEPEPEAPEAVLAAAHESEPDPEPAPPLAVPDDLTRLVGVGPRTASALMERGVTRFADLAAWTVEDLAAFDAERKLKGRSLRDAWIEQAKRLADEA